MMLSYCKKFIRKYPKLGHFTQPKCIHFLNDNAPNWIQQISFGSLVEPSDNFYQKVLNYEEASREFNGNQINREPQVIQKLSKFIFKKYGDISEDVLTAYVRQRTYIRIKYLNHKLAEKTINVATKKILPVI